MPIQMLKKLTRFAFADGGSLRARVIRSGMWLTVAEFGLQTLNIARSAFLARLLTPEMFGLMGLALIVVRAIETFTRPGVTQALIARQESFEDASATAFTLLVGRGLLLTIILASAAPWVAHFYEAEQLEPMLQCLALVFLIGSFNNINVVARHRELDFRRVTYLNQMTALAGTVVTVLAAWWMRSVWALVIGQIVSACFMMLLSYHFVGGRVRFAFDKKVAAELMSYGKFITGSSIILYIATELDSAVVGKMLGMEQLGFYALALTVANLVTANLAKTASSIMMPAYSKMQSDLPALRRAYLRTLSLVVFLLLPATAGLILVAEPLIRVVYGERWLPAVLPLRILALFGFFRALAAFSGYLFEGMGKPKIGLRVGLLRLMVVAPAIAPMTLQFGLAGAAMTVTAGMAVQWLASLVFLYRELQIRLNHLLALLWRPLWTAAAMSLVVFLVEFTWSGSVLAGLAVTVACAILTYGLLNLSFLLELRREGLR